MRKSLALFLCLILFLLACQQIDTSSIKLESATVFSDQEKTELTEMLHKFDNAVCALSSKSKISDCYIEFIYSSAIEMDKGNLLPLVNNFTQEEREEILSSLSPSLRNEIWESYTEKLSKRVEGSFGKFILTFPTIKIKFGKYAEFLDTDLSKISLATCNYVERLTMQGYRFNPFYLHNHFDELDINNEQLRLSIAIQYLNFCERQTDINKSTDEFYDGIKNAFKDRRRKQQEEVKQ